MKTFKTKKQIKISKLLMIIISLIFFLTFILFSWYSQKVSPKVMEVAKIKLEKFTQSFLSRNIGYGILNDKNLENILQINKNKDGEILYVDYNLDKAYEALEIITNVLYENINSLEKGNFSGIDDTEISSTKNGLLLELPFFISSNNPLLASLGPKIYIRVDFVGSILTNINSKITNYGMNNVLVELYVTIKITEELITPVTKEQIIVDYDVLVASKVINGRVPLYYGGLLSNDSNILETTINN